MKNIMKKNSFPSLMEGIKKCIENDAPQKGWSFSKRLMQNIYSALADEIAGNTDAAMEKYRMAAGCLQAADHAQKELSGEFVFKTEGISFKKADYVKSSPRNKEKINSVCAQMCREFWATFNANTALTSIIEK